MQPAWSKRNHRAAQKHWRDTLDQFKPFTESRYAAALTPSQISDLRRMHPAGTAQFWGATRVQDKNMQKLSTGNIALFAGDNLVRGIGEIGVVFQNAAFGDLLWDPDPDNGSWRNVYSLRVFQPVQIPYTELWAIWARRGLTKHPVFQGLWPLDDVRASAILEFLGEFLGLQTQESADLEDRQQEQLISRLGAPAPRSNGTLNRRVPRPARGRVWSTSPGQRWPLALAGPGAWWGGLPYRFASGAGSIAVSCG